MFLSFFFLFSFPASAQEKIFNAETFTLDNGLQAVVIPNDRAPVVTLMVWYKVGAIDEGPRESGLAHFVEHLMFKGTEKTPPGAFSKRIRALGGSDNAFTGEDYTAYHESIAVEHLEEMLRLEADRMRGLTFPAEHVLSERDVVVQERRERTDNDPRGYFYEQMRSLLFVNHPYGNPVIGWLHEVDTLERENVRAFYDAWYAPNNAILVVSGDTTAAKLKPLAEKYFGPLPRREIPKREWTEVPPLTGLPRLVLNHPAIQQPVLQRLYRAPSYAQSREDSLALQVLEDVMDGGSATRLYRTLVVEKKIATSASFGYRGGSLSDGTLSLSATPAEGMSMDALEAAADDVIRALITGGVTEQELREAKDRMKDDAVFARDSLEGPAMIFGQTLAAGGTIDDVEYWPDLIEKVTAAQVQDAAKRFLDPDNYGTRPYVTGWLLPEKKKEKAE